MLFRVYLNFVFRVENDVLPQDIKDVFLAWIIILNILLYKL